jgi:diguanylate cyclase (GGDEF)-like protein
MKSQAEVPELQPFLDGLTGLHSRPGFLLLADQQHRVQQRSGIPAVLFRIDVEGLERISDEHGHDETDAVLVAVGDLLRMTFRDADIAAHIGEGQFAVLALDCEAVDVLRQRLRTHVAEYTDLFPRPYALTVNVQVQPLANAPFVPVDALLARRKSGTDPEFQRSN